MNILITVPGVRVLGVKGVVIMEIRQNLYLFERGEAMPQEIISESTNRMSVGA